MKFRKNCQIVKFVGFLLMGASLSGCLGPWAKKLADRQVYPIIEDKQVAALGAAREFTIEHESDELTEKVLSVEGKASDEFTTDGLRITLADTLGLAVRNSRSYLSAKENLYLSALRLTEERHEFSPIFSGDVGLDFDRDPVADEFGEFTDANRKATLGTDLAVSKVIAVTGARITVSLANTFTRLYSSPFEDPTGSGTVTASIVQPLLRGAGMRVAIENLKQAERDVIYEVRDFSRFEKDFIVDRIEEYFRLLQQLDAVNNERRSYRNLRDGRLRNEALAAAGRLDSFQVDQARQQELTARNRWINAQTNFIQQLDSLKINLGLPTDLKIFPDETELAKLMDGELQPPEITASNAVELALERRLDLRTAEDEVEDAERKLYIAENSLLPDLDVSARVSVPDEGDNRPLGFDTRMRDVNYSADLELPLDRKQERNNYRRALITLERLERSRELSRDTVIQDVRSAFQNLQEARQTYEIQEQSLDVAERRVDSSKMLLNAGRKTVRDVLESEEDLRDARNGLTRAVIDYTVAELRFLVAIEALEIDDRGMWSDADRATTPAAQEN